MAGSFRFAPCRRRRRFRRRIPHPLDLGDARRMARGARSAPRRDQQPARGRLQFQPSPASAGCPPPIRARCRRWCSSTRVTSPIFPGIGRSPIPVLLPFDAAGYLERAAERRTGQPPGVALSGRLPSRRSVRCRASRLRRGVLARAGCRRRPAAADFRKAGRGPDHRLAPDLRSRTIRLAARASRSSRSRRNFPICAASSAKAMCATPSPASACPMWSRSSASTRRAARAPAGLPRGLSRRRAFPEGAAHRRRPAVAAAPGYRLGQLSSGRSRPRPISPIGRAATSSPTAAPASRAAAPT